MKKISVILIYLFWCLPPPCFSSKQIHLTLADSTMVNELISFANEERTRDIVKAEKEIKNTIEVAKMIKYNEGLAKGHSVLGNIYLDKGNYVESIKEFQKSYEVSNKINYTKGLGIYYFNMYLLRFNQASYADAAAYLIRAVTVAEQTKDSIFIARCYSASGSIGRAMNNYEPALENYDQALKIYSSLNDTAGIALTNVNIGIVYMNKNEYVKATIYYDIARKNYESIQDKKGVASTYRYLGRTDYLNGNYPASIQHTNEALKIYKELENKDGISYCYSTLGRMNIELGKYKEARKNLNDAIEIISEVGLMINLRNNYLYLSQLDSAEGNYKQAYEHHKMYFAVHDSIFSVRNTEKLAELKLEYQFDKKLFADSVSFAHQKQITDVKLRDQRILTAGGFGASALTILLLFFVYSNYKKQRKTNQQLRETQEQLIRSEKLAAFGMMASRVAHEIQNPLNFVNNFSEVSKDLVKEIAVSGDKADREQCAELLLSNLGKIKEHGSRAASIVDQLLEHSRRGTAHDFFENN